MHCAQTVLHSGFSTQGTDTFIQKYLCVGTYTKLLGEYFYKIHTEEVTMLVSKQRRAGEKKILG